VDRDVDRREHLCASGLLSDPYGDFDLIFGAAKLNLRIVEIPVRYHERTYGAPNIRRFADGWLLLRMSALAAGRLFFTA